MIEKISGKNADTFVFTNAKGCRLTMTNYGARLMQLFVPDREGKLGDVLVGFDTAEEYFGNNPCFGATVGRVANRIADARACLNGREYMFDLNDDTGCRGCLHGGFRGYQDRLWRAEIEGDVLSLSLTSPDGDQGFPGNLELNLQVSLTDDNEVVLAYRAQSNADTFCNPTNHTYFNLGGENCADVLGHEMKINASAVSFFDAETGKGGVRPVAGTALDFRAAKSLGRDIAADEPLLTAWGGYDLNYVIDGSGFRAAVEVCEPTSGRTLEMFTDMPGVQLYSGNLLDASGKGRKYPRHGAFCLEAQGYPYAPNEPAFPSVVLKKGETYTQRTVYRFGVK